MTVDEAEAERVTLTVEVTDDVMVEDDVIVEEKVIICVDVVVVEDVLVLEGVPEALDEIVGEADAVVVKQFELVALRVAVPVVDGVFVAVE